MNRDGAQGGAGQLPVIPGRAAWDQAILGVDRLASLRNLPRLLKL